MTRATSSRRRDLAIAIGIALTLVATSCSIGKDKTTVTTATLGPRPIESGLPADAKPVRGGQLVYGLEAESEGWCLPESQLAISGLQIARTIYDPLVTPNGKGEYAPYLAKSLTHDADYKTWTIALRSGITFHDGSALDAQVVKENLDAYRGAPGNPRASLLFMFVLNNIDKVTVKNELTVEVTTKKPWVAFPAILYSSGRILMIAHKQLVASKNDCDTKPIGTGPFSFVSWNRGVSLKVKRNPGYWQIAPDKKPYPYLNAIDFRPMSNGDARIAALQAGEINLMHTSTASDIAKNLTRLRDDGAINLLVSEERTETGYIMFNAQKAPFGDRDARVAVAQAIDRNKLNELGNRGFATIADGPFAPEVMGHLDDPGFPKYDLEAARKTVAKMKQEGRDTSLELLCTSALASIRQSSLTKAMLEQAGFTVTLVVESEAVLITRVIAGTYEMATFRNQPGDDPDTDYVWWYGGGNPVNFGKFDDPVINANLDKGRTNPDPAVRRAAYEAVNRQMAKQAYNVYLWFQPWAIAEAPNVHGILGPDLPDGSKPPGRLATGHSVLGLWIDPGTAH